MSHIPVLLNEVVDELKPCPGEFMIDGTADGGGHAHVLADKIGPTGKLLALDWDFQMAEKLKSKFQGRAEVMVRQGNYADLEEIMAQENLPKADGLLLDLGFSSEQLEGTGRGFSFMEDEPLLMTYDDSRESAKSILRRLNEKELADAIYAFSEERRSRRIAKAIKEHLRARKPLETTFQLKEVIERAIPVFYERGRIHPATRTFQALRILVNGELDNLSKILSSIPAILNPGARVAIISFHSLEDRIVKNAFREMEKKNIAAILTKKPITASKDEIKTNPRSRSAKLRAITLNR
jgi:16S rRNA (cytosine1402-N4)-methyltransferase